MQYIESPTEYTKSDKQLSIFLGGGGITISGDITEYPDYTLNHVGILALRC